MPAALLLLGHDKDYYGATIGHDGIAAAVHKIFEVPHHLSHGDALLEFITDCSTVIPAERLQSYGASFARTIPAAIEPTLVDRLSRLFQELLGEADSHKADYVLVHSLEIKSGHFVGGEVSVWAQMLNDRISAPPGQV